MLDEVSTDMKGVYYKGIPMRDYIQSFTISNTHQLEIIKSPLLGSTVQSIGVAPLVFECVIVLYGADAISSYNLLRNMFADTTSGTLSTPDGESHYAFFSKLSLEGNGGENALICRLTFVEDTERARRG